MKKPSRSGGYYGFRKDYPEKTGNGGLYPTDSGSEKMSARAKLITAIAAVLVFVTAFIAVSAAMDLSERPSKDSAGVTAPITDTADIGEP